MSEQFFYSINHELFPVVYKMLLVIIPVVMPFMLIYLIWVIRLKFVHLRFVESQKPVLLEIKLPKEITKSPAAMEIFFTYLKRGGAGGYIEAYVDGKTRPWFSCELVSTGGVVHFYIWASQAKYKDLIEAQLYAQFPNIEIFEVKEDYTKTIDFDMKKYSIHGFQLGLLKPDPYPIKTYIEYGLDREDEEEFKVDPITAVIEYLGALKPGEHAWMQILIQKYEKEGWKHGSFRDGKDLKKETKEEIKTIRESTMSESEEGAAKFKFPNPTKGEMEKIASIERNAAKEPFECMIRIMYIAEQSAFKSMNRSFSYACFRHYNSSYLNGFKNSVSTGTSDLYDDLVRIFPFLKPFKDHRIYKLKKDFFHAYKLRSFFQWPYKNYETKPFILSVEELATIFHFPSGIVSQTPTLNRVPSRKSEAPANLPI